jgi:hypothetical protein
MPLAPDPADKGADQFQPRATARRTGGWTVQQWIDYLRRHPDATLPSGVGGSLVAELDRLTSHHHSPSSHGNT